MNESELELGENAVYRIQSDWDVDTVTEQIFGELNGTVARSTIQEVIKDVIPKYEGARIQTFVPIFIRRDAVDQLKAMQALFSTPAMATNEADGK
jgi:formaldehyde-activating enzyme involved in methanogenesis